MLAPRSTPNEPIAKTLDGVVNHLTRSRFKFCALKAHFLDLIQLEFAVEPEKIGVTMAILPSSPKRDKPKLLDEVRDVMRRKHCSIRTEQSRLDPAFHLVSRQTPSRTNGRTRGDRIPYASGAR
jgi:hypothetical protein